MSRETDSSSPGPQGRGGTAYPSGTPPYGTGQYPSLQPREETRGSANGEQAKEAAADEPRTETTLTTRIRINIPGSRPIPPVVVRKPVGEAGDEDAAEPAGETTGEMPAWPSLPGASSAPSAAAPAPADAAPRGGTAKSATAKTGAEKPTSDWFAPRKPPAAAPASGQPQAPAAGPVRTPPGPAPAAARQNIPYLGDADDLPAGFPAAGEPPFGGGAPAAPAPFPGGAAYGSQAGSGGAFGDAFVGAGSGAQAGSGGAFGGAGSGSAAAAGGPDTGTAPFPGAAPGADRRPVPPLFDKPAGPTTGPVTGDARLPGAEAGPRLPGSDSGQGGTGYRPVGGSPFGSAAADGSPFGSAAADGSPFGSAAADGSPFGSAAPSGTPAGATSVRGIPAMPAPQQAAAAPKSAAAPARKGRSKLMLAAVGLVGAVAVVYGVGLLMDHADVPNGTVVMGTNVGGKTRDEAMRIINAAAAGPRGTAPLQLKVGGQTVQLRPDLAGLSVNPQDTVDEVAHSDYDPISVISALFGGKDQVAPAVTVDQEKLRSRLQELSTGFSGGSDGMVRFVDGRPVPVPGKPYQTIDVNASMQLITNAYLQRAETGQDAPVTVAVQNREPKVTQAEIDRAIKEIGDPAMSGKITVVAGTRSVLFSPQRSLSKILTLVPDDQGQLVLHFDLAVLKQLYGNAFDGVLLERGDGSKTPVTPNDVAAAMMPELRKTAAVKTAVISNLAK